MRTLLAIVLVGGAVLLGARGARLLGRGLRNAGDDAAPLWVARALRDLVVAIGLVSLASGILFEQSWLLVFGGIFLAEEIYETGVLVLVLRADLRAPGHAPGRSRVTCPSTACSGGGRGWHDGPRTSRRGRHTTHGTSPDGRGCGLASRRRRRVDPASRDSIQR